MDGHTVSFPPFLNSSCWWWLISSVFLIRISCHKTAHANGYYGAWPGWAVSVTVLPLTQPSHPLSSPFPLALSLSYIMVFSNELALRIRRPKWWSFSISISPSNEYSGLISFRIDWLDLFAVQGTSQESSLAPQFKSINLVHQ